MKTELTIEQSQRLIELGVNPNLASKEVTEKHPITENEIPYNIFTLADLLAILPRWIKHRNKLLLLHIWVDSYSEEWCAAYKDDVMDSDEADTFQSSKELVDCLALLLECLITDKLITL